MPCIMQDDRGLAEFAVFLACDRRGAQKPSWPDNIDWMVTSSDPRLDSRCRS